MSEKLTSSHLQRKAMLYVRQSSPYQVLHNKESQRLQYGMSRRLQALGWSEIETVDEDLGRTASGAVERAGFKRMVAEVGLGQVGAVAARELSRFARNSRDWHQLIEICSFVDTVLVDQEMVYNPRNGNDRLLLGLKGSLNEYELDLFRQRAVAARQAKAARGELVVAAPVGYLRTRDQHLEKDPDRRVQHTITTVFEKFLELGSARQTLMWFLDNEIDLPARRHTPEGWEISWQRPVYGAIYTILTHPVYAGSYVYGRTKLQTKYVDGQARKRIARKPREDWSVLLHGRYEGYISWEIFERIQRMMSDNVASFRVGSPGAVKKGPSLLAGLLVCGRCGKRLTLSYTGNNRHVPRYCCIRGSLDSGEPRCISFGGLSVDEAVSQEVLRVVEPWAIEAAVAATEDAVAQQDAVVDALQLEVQAARYAAERARRQYDSVEPENRLVAMDLEARWNASLKKVQALEHRLEEAQNEHASAKKQDTASLLSLAADMPRVWHDATTDIRLKKRIIRTLVESILVDIDEDENEIEFTIRWKGGVHTTLRTPRRRRGHSAGHTPPDTAQAIRQLARVSTDDVIASFLNRNGLKTGRGNRWTRQRVTSFRSKRKIPRYVPGHESDYLNLTDAADTLGVSSSTIRRLISRGTIEAAHPLADGPWVIDRSCLDDPMVHESLARLQRRNRRPEKAVSSQRNLDIPDT